MIQSTDTELFLVRFQNTKITNICDVKGLNELLKVNKFPLDFIKLYDSNKEKWQKLEKPKLSQLVSYHTELHLELISRNFIKE